ncbi:Indole-3-acetic acid-induced protein ARG7 [Linum grandiflorum]
MEAGRRCIPKDVPRGHMAVYVGEEWKRYVIKVCLINHPLFRTLLDQLIDDHEAQDFRLPLHIPCTDSIFLAILNCAKRDGIGGCTFWRRFCF